MNYDYHTHSYFSSDSDSPMEDMIKGAIAKGITHMALTDHSDPGYEDPEFPFILDVPKYVEETTELIDKYKNKINLVRGVEMGIMEGQLDAAEEIIEQGDFGYVIGSFHCYKKDDFYRLDFTDVDLKQFAETFYLYMYDCLKKFRNFDVIGHFSIIDRYMGVKLDYGPYMDIIREILKDAIYDGKGIEINTSSFKYNTGFWLPQECILKAYKELGGEIFTIGSDAHEPARLGDHIDEAAAFAQSLGFKYYCTFKDRKPEFHKF